MNRNMQERLQRAILPVLTACGWLFVGPAKRNSESNLRCSQYPASYNIVQARAYCFR